MGALVVMAVGGALMAFVPKVKQMQTYQKTCDTLQQRIDSTLSAEKDFKTRQQRFQTEAYYVEKIAHEVGYAYEDEVIFQFLEDSATNGPIK